MTPAGMLSNSFPTCSSCRARHIICLRVCTAGVVAENIELLSPPSSSSHGMWGKWRVHGSMGNCSDVEREVHLRGQRGEG